MSETRYLIVNADDFGQSVGINDGIIEAFELGIVTSTSLMVRWPSAHQAVHYARKHPHLSVGLHLDLGEWAYRKGHWTPLYEVVQKHDVAAVVEETERQLFEFRSLIGKEPSHIDSHQHVHRGEPVSSILVEIARRVGVPLRMHSRIQYCGAFYGQTADGEPLSDHITLEGLKRFLAELPAGITELGCHPAKQIDIDTMYTSERVEELAVLCDGGIRRFLAENRIQLCSFNNVPKLLR